MLRGSYSYLMIALASFSLTWGCATASDEDATPQGSADAGKEAAQDTSCFCTPGKTATCSCPNERVGIQTCGDNCMSYGACQCPDTADTGTPDSTSDALQPDSDEASTEAAPDSTTKESNDTCPGELVVLKGDATHMTWTTTGNTESLTSGDSATCTNTDGSNDAVYRVVAPDDGLIRVNLGGAAVTNFDSVLYVRSTCDNQDDEIECADVYEPGGESIQLVVSKGDTFFVFVDYYHDASAPGGGAYQLIVDFHSKGCGNGILETGEACDDGNKVDNDWCHNNCTKNTAPAADMCPGVVMQMSNAGPQTVRQGKVVGTTVGLKSDFGDPKCASYSSSKSSPDAVIAITSDVEGSLSCDLGGAQVTPFTALLTLRTTCDDPKSEVGCSYETKDGASALKNKPVEPNTTYYVILDGYSSTETGPFVLNCSIAPAICGNGSREGKEQCDDGNPNNDDGCDKNCRIEPKDERDVCPGMDIALTEFNGSYLAMTGHSTTGYADGYNGSCGDPGAPEHVYHLVSPINGLVDLQILSTGTDHASALYVREGACEGAAGKELICNDAYGNGTDKVAFHAVKDKDYWFFVDGDGVGIAGNYRIQLNIKPTCANSVIDPGESCDDGNLEPGDGCDASCSIEAECRNVPDTEPNDWAAPQEVPAACGTFLIDSAAISPVGDGDHFLLRAVPTGAKVLVATFTNQLGQCDAGTILVTSLFKSPITAANPNMGSCSLQKGLTCAELPTSGNCNQLSYTVPSTYAGDLVLKVHSWATNSTVAKYSVQVTIM